MKYSPEFPRRMDKEGNITPQLWKRKIYLLSNLMMGYSLCFVHRLEARGDIGLQRGLGRVGGSFPASLST